MCLKNKLLVGRKLKNIAYVLLTDLWPDILVIMKGHFFCHAYDFSSFCLLVYHGILSFG